MKQSMMQFAWICVFALAMTCEFGLSAVEARKDDKKAQKKREEVRAMAHERLGTLYSAQPSARSAIENAKGYAVFSNFGMKIFVAGGGSGRGIAVNNNSMRETFMKMAEIQAGLGMGVKKFSVVFVFETEEALNSFINKGWKLGGQATAAAKTKDKGGAFAGAVTVGPGIWMYQLTDKGLAAEITAKGTKYFKDKELN